MTIEHSTDEQKLIRRLSLGDETAFEAVFYRYRGKVSHFVRRSAPVSADWEELVMEVFTRIWVNRAQLDPERPFEAYLFRAARNILIDEMRKKVARSVYLHEGAFAADFGENDTDSRIEDQELQNWFEAVLRKIPEQRRQVFTMNRIEGLTYREIAGKLNISENTVDTQIRRALHFFRDELKKFRSFLFTFF